MAQGNRIMEEVFTKFYRKGEVGDWKNHLRGQALQDFDDWIERNRSGTGIHFTFQLNNENSQGFNRCHGKGIN
jgi:hypothetical protein